MYWLRGSVAVLAVMAAGCDRLTMSKAAPGPPPAVAAPPSPVADIETFTGRSYAEFTAAHQDRFTAGALGLAPTDSGRLQHAMAASTGALLEGGGAEAIIFRGCAANGCGEGIGVVAIDGATGAAFVGVKDSAGRDVLASNERLEALLRLNTPTRDWIDAGPAQTAPEPPPAEAPRP